MQLKRDFLSTASLVRKSITNLEKKLLAINGLTAPNFGANFQPSNIEQ
jgi:hypothetical protein